MIFRLVAKNTIDESIVQRAQAKRSIEKLVVHQDKFKSGHSSLKETTEKVLSANDIMAILLSKAQWTKIENPILKFFFETKTCFMVNSYLLDVLWGQPIKLIQVVSTSEFHEYWWIDLEFTFFVPSTCCRASEVQT